MEEKEVLVSCSFCSKEVPCPESMLKSEKHACFECFLKLQDKLNDDEIGKIHLAIPKDKAEEMYPHLLISQVMGESFPSFWRDKKEEFKQVSRKEIAEKSFLTGAIVMSKLMEELSKESEELEEKEKIG